MGMIWVVVAHINSIPVPHMDHIISPLSFPVLDHTCPISTALVLRAPRIVVETIVKHSEFPC